MTRVQNVLGKVQLTGASPNGGEPTAAILGGVGSPAAPLVTSFADKNFLDLRTKSAATSGTTRGIYNRLYLSSGAGGESLRTFTTVESNTPADTCNGIHSSLNFGATVGNITGLATASRNTLHIPGRAIGGTIAAVQAEIYGDAASGAVGAGCSFLRMIVDGHSDLKGSMNDNGFLFDVQGLTAAADHLFRAAAPTTLAASLRVKVGATTYYLPLYSAPA